MDELTVFCPFTRLWAVEPFFEALEQSDVPFGRARFVAYVDAKGDALAEAVERRARRSPFVAVEVHVSGVNSPGDRVGPRRRRYGHAVMREASKRLIGDGELLLLEDDTLIPAVTYAPLSETLRDCDWASGVEVGRWGSRRPPGIWRISKEDGRFRQKEALLPSGKDRELVDAVGFYCGLTTGCVYKEADYGVWNDLIGHDTHTTYRLTERGCRLMVDWRVACVHLTPTGRYTIADALPYVADLSNCEALGLCSIRRAG